MVVNPGSAICLDDRRVYARNLEVPSGGAVGTARAIAHAYSVFATGGHDLQTRRQTLDHLAAPAIPPAHGFHHECLKEDVHFSLGFADPATGVGYAYVTSQMGASLTGDPRDVALRDALDLAVRASPHA